MQSTTAYFSLCGAVAWCFAKTCLDPYCVDYTMEMRPKNAEMAVHGDTPQVKRLNGEEE